MLGARASPPSRRPGLTYTHNLILKPQLHSYLTGRFGIKTVPKRPVWFREVYSAFGPTPEASLCSAAGPGDHYLQTHTHTHLLTYLLTYLLTRSFVIKTVPKDQCGSFHTVLLIQRQIINNVFFTPIFVN